MTHTVNLASPLNNLGFRPQKDVYCNLGIAQLIETAVKRHECVLSHTGAMIVETGEHTGRSPNDKFIVDYGTPYDLQIAWGKTNKAISPEKYQNLLTKVLNHLEKSDLFVQDVIAGRDEKYAKSFRLISEKAWAALFARDLLKPVELSTDEAADFLIIHAPEYLADPEIDGTRSGTFIILDFKQNIVLIGGSSYAGEIKKSVFTVMNRILPAENVFPMHCSANIGVNGDTALYFGLSGTGKTTLSSSQDRFLIGDDEHGWSENGVFNFENGCYAKTINLSQEFEPLIWEASQRFGSVLENVGFDSETRIIDFNDGSKTENTRAAYPINFIEGHVESGKGGHPGNVFFLCADAFGVMPPISLLSREQAVYYFFLGYTAKLAGTEKGLGSEPEATFSTGFGEPFLPLPPAVYANLLLQRIDEYKPRIWLINTGWSGGSFGTGKRISISYSRAMIRMALEKDVTEVSFHIDPYFGLSIPDAVEDVPADILDPINTWRDKEAYKVVAQNLIQKMQQRMQIFEHEMSPEILNSGPK